MLRFLPWKFIVQRAARAYGFADPALWLARIRSFAQPSDVQEPLELLRAGVLFHARGIVNAKAIQHNLDWVWPYWVERQFDPEDISFIPRAFSLSHINLTHRNWTAVGLPDLPIYPIVDPRGLVTPLYDGWSIDCWLIGRDGEMLLPSRLHDDAVEQRLIVDPHQAVATSSRRGRMAIEQSAVVKAHHGQPVLELSVRAKCTDGGSLVVALRPYNPEGVQFIDDIESLEGRDGWFVNSQTEVLLDRPADAMLASDYAGGDVFARLNVGSISDAENTLNSKPPSASETPPTSIRCKVGMATAAAVYRFDGSENELTVRVPLGNELKSMGEHERFYAVSTWPEVRSQTAELRLPDERIQSLYDAAVQTLVLLSAGEIVPGPYTYRRFWFRDACLMMNALLSIGLTDRCRHVIEGFPTRQLRSGYFRSQEGEWDSNGQVLWIIDRYEQLTGKSLKSLRDAVLAAVRWIDAKRVKAPATLHDGLLPPGFSAEHLGPNDHYYWDDYWAEGGLRAARRILRRAGRNSDADHASMLADELRRAIEQSIANIPVARSLGGITASPYRRMDAGAIGSLVADYPLQLYPAGERRIMATAEAILSHYFHKGGFFQDIIHSGINAYLTLDVAQTLLRAGDARYRKLMETVAHLASPTGQWPEAIHPQTLGGCMGDGQHGWAAAEWVMMIRNCFVREDGDRLIIGSGLFAEWFDTDDDLVFGPTLTPWGPVTIRVAQPRSLPTLSIDVSWQGEAPRIEVMIPRFQPQEHVAANTPILLKDKSSAFADACTQPQAPPGVDAGHGRALLQTPGRAGG
jgi:hypothetical protein